MRAALSYELARIRTIRSTYWLTAVAVLLGGGLSVLSAFGIAAAMGSADAPTGEDLSVLPGGILTQFGSLGAPYLLAYVLAMLGVFTWGHEYRHGMIRATLTSVHSRSQVWAAKAVVTLVWCAAVVVVVMLVALLAGRLFLGRYGIDMANADTASVAGRTVVYALLFVLLAMSFTCLVRNQTAALVLLFLVPLAGEPLIRLVVSLVPGFDAPGPALPVPALRRGHPRCMTQDDTSAWFGDPLSAGGGFVVLALVTGALAVGSWLLFLRRDA